MANIGKQALRILLLLLAAGQFALAAGRWELKVCAEPNDPPASNERQEGFENRIVQLLAEELGASLSYVWLPTSLITVRDHMRVGACDLIMGVPDGFLGLLSTIPYYQIPHVFIYRQDSPFEIRSLEDEALKRLKVGTYPLSLADFALRNQGINPILLHPSNILSQIEVSAPLIQALRERSIDVAILSGSVAAQYSKQYPGEFKIVPVSPEIAPPFVPMFQIGTIAVRPGDESLRDELNLAIARRWEAIQQVFQSYGIPLLPLPRPNLPQPLTGQSLKIGAVLPIPTGTPAITDALGEAARHGALIAEDLLGREAASRGVNLQLFLASGPSPEASLRAAQRLVNVEGVSALIGGFSPDEARQLSQLATESRVLFLNVAAPDDSLRQACSPYTFHIEASAAMYLDAVVRWSAAQGKLRWFVLYPGSQDGQALYRRAIQAISAAGGEEVGKAELPPEQRIYTGAIEAIQRVRPAVVLSLLDPPNQDFFLAQFGDPVEGLSIVHFPYPVTQTRRYWMRIRQSTSSAESTYRPDLWEATLSDGSAGEINDQFGSRSGSPMDPSAWAAYAAVKIVLESALATGSTDPARLLAYLEDPKTRFDLYKGVPLSFRPWDHQLRQPLYLVRVNPKAEIGTRLSQQLALAELVAQVPNLPQGSDPIPLLDRLGDPAQGSPCRR
jgi:ABC-type branched-subunit amino acid transport system substrate-binding protein/ABC-type amino acid transport substrate-binding protein